MGFTGLYLRFI